MPNAETSKFQVQLAFTDLGASEVAQVANFFQTVNKKAMHATKLAVKMLDGGSQPSAPSVAQHIDERASFTSMQSQVT